MKPSCCIVMKVLGIVLVMPFLEWAERCFPLNCCGGICRDPSPNGEFFYYSFFMANKYDDEGAQRTILIWFYILRFAFRFCYVPRKINTKDWKGSERRDLRSQFSFSAESTICHTDPSRLEGLRLTFAFRETLQTSQPTFRQISILVYCIMFWDYVS